MAASKPRSVSPIGDIMKLHIASSLTYIYRLLLNTCPPAYRSLFGDEMYDTFFEGVEEAESLGTLPFSYSARFVIFPECLSGPIGKNGWLNWKPGSISCKTSHQPPTFRLLPPDGRDSWRQVLFEMSLFLAAGLLLILVIFPFEGVRPGWQRDVQFLRSSILPFTAPVLLFSLMRGLPRWAYPFAGLLLCYSGFVAGQTDLWLFLTIMFLASSVLFLATILTNPQPSRLPIPIRRIGQSFSLDWTRLSFAVYGAMPLVILMAIDDFYFDNRTPFLALSVLAMIVCGFLYSRGRTKSLQMLTLFAGMTFSLGCAWLDRITVTNGMSSWIIVSSRTDAGNLWLFFRWIQWIVLLLSPGLLLGLGRTLSRKLTV